MPSPHLSFHCRIVFSTKDHIPAITGLCFALVKTSGTAYTSTVSTVS